MADFTQNNSEIQHIINAIQYLPTLPNISARLTDMIRSSTASTSDIARIVELDPALASKMLSIVNSAAFGVKKKIQSIQEAVTFLGTKTLSHLALSLSIIATFKGTSDKRFNHAEFWTHSVAVAIFAREIARVSRVSHQLDEIFTAGLLHDLGKIALDQFLTPFFKRVLDSIEKEPMPFYQAEDKLFGINHARIGEWVARNWELPLLTVVAIRHHHEKPDVRHGFNLSNDSTVDIIRIADWLAVTQNIGSSGSPVVENPGVDSFLRLSLTPEEADGIARELHGDIASAVDSLGLK
ncbi:MAG: HDOD domain-containing protein [Spirochaetales bacterium]|nr:HDOD domain-containing protein [Spirochaetales bacterium]